MLFQSTCCWLISVRPRAHSALRVRHCLCTRAPARRASASHMRTHSLPLFTRSACSWGQHTLALCLRRQRTRSTRKRSALTRACAPSRAPARAPARLTRAHTRLLSSHGVHVRGVTIFWRCAWRLTKDALTRNKECVPTLAARGKSRSQRIAHDSSCPIRAHFLRPHSSTPFWTLLLHLLKACNSQILAKLGSRLRAAVKSHKSS